MEINKPNQGVFKGMGRLETNAHINRKYFPNIRNMNQFQYSHNHQSSFKTSMQTYKTHEKEAYFPNRVNKYSNQSQIVIGIGNRSKLQTENSQHFRKYDFTLPPQPIRHSEEGIGINEYEKRTGEKIVYTTTSNDTLGPYNKIKPDNVKYKYTRTDRFNPITGEQNNNTTFGFEDFIPRKEKGYKANNFTVMPRRGQTFDIISGRTIQQI